MNAFDFVIEGQTGEDYELEYCEGLSKGLNDHFKRATVYEDKFEGTDAFIDGVRVDFTFAFDKKDHIEHRFIKYIEELDLHLGIRTGNNSGAVFEEPVVVIGENREPSYIRDWVLPNLSQFAKDNCERIADAVSDLYCEYCDYLDEIA